MGRTRRIMTQDPITNRFIEVFDWLKDEGRVRSARQFAMSINTYPQSFNDIRKGRREATLQMIQKLTEVHNINSHYLLTGQGALERKDVNGISTSPQLSLRYLQAHQFGAYASAIAHGNIDEHEWDMWQLPSELLGSQIELAIQCNTDRLSSCIGKGDVLFSRRIPREAWKSNLSSRRVYMLTLNEDVLIVRINDNNAEGIFLSQDDRNMPDYIPYSAIQEIWCPTSKWTNNVVSRQGPTDLTELRQINEQLACQAKALDHMQETMQRLSHRDVLQGQF